MSTSRFLREAGIYKTCCGPLQSGNRFKKLDQVGEGYGGRVVKSVDKKTGDVVALKIIDLKESKRDRVIAEVANHSKLRHENIINLREVFVKQDRYVYLVLDYADLGDMQQFLIQKRGGVLPENMAKYFFRQIVKGVQYMHSLEIVNRDIKLANILVLTDKDSDEQLPTIKLCDFGFSCDCKTKTTTSCVGTPEYVPPEIVLANDVEEYDGYKVDSWSCGVVLYNLVTGYQPFSGLKVGGAYDKKTGDAFIDKIMDVDYGYPQNVRLSEECMDLIDACLVGDPKERISIDEILDHPWLNQEPRVESTMSAIDAICIGT